MDADFQTGHDNTGATNVRPHGLSIIIPCHNCGDTLADTVQSLIANKPRDFPFEIIMVNDAPTDGATQAAIERMARHCN